MCGIAGILRSETKPDNGILEEMLAAIVHRGPDDSGVFREGNLAMGMRRLSIIDIKTGHQPITNEDGSVVIVMNGEIYNYVELRKELRGRGHGFKTDSDTEVLVHLYEEEGPELLSHLNGMFGLAIWDRDKQQLLLARDRLGIKPLYYSILPDGLIFASELKSILASGQLQTTLDPESLFDYLAYRYIPGEATPFREIKKLLPGNLLIAGREKTSTRCWWKLIDHTQPADISKSEATEQIHDLFFDAVRLRLRSDVPVGAYLSGGLDSSLITAAAVRQTDNQIDTFSVGFSQTKFDELPYAREVSNRYGTRHHEITVSPADLLDHLPQLVWHLDEPNGDAAILPTYLISDLTRQHVKVALSGLGGDELFGGYSRYHQMHGKFGFLSYLPPFVLKLLRPLLGPMKERWHLELERMIAAYPPWRDYLERVRLFDEKNTRLLLGNDNYGYGHLVERLFGEYQGSDYVNRRLYVDAHSYLPDQILAITDRMSMAVSLEARVPFLDHRLVEFVTTLPGHWKVSGNGWKLILKESMKDLVPESIISRPKWGFGPPIVSWLQGGQLRDLFGQLCQNGRLVGDGIMDKQYLGQLLRSGELTETNADWLWLLVILEIWYRLFSSAKEPLSRSVTLHDLVDSR